MPTDQQRDLALAPVGWTRNGIADHVADNWPDRKYSLDEIEQRLRAIEINAPIGIAQPAAAPLTDYCDGVNMARLEQARLKYGLPSYGQEESAARVSQMINQLTAAVMAEGKEQSL